MMIGTGTCVGATVGSGVGIVGVASVEVGTGVAVAGPGVIGEGVAVLEVDGTADDVGTITGVGEEAGFVGSADGDVTMDVGT
jgi:hypothetical protein